MAEELDLIVKHHLQEEKNYPEVQDWAHKLKEVIEPVVRDLLQHDMAKLLNILYRIDVIEEKADRVLQESEPSMISSDLTDLIIDRQLEKIKWRRKYRDG